MINTSYHDHSIKYVKGSKLANTGGVQEAVSCNYQWTALSDREGYSLYNCCHRWILIAYLAHTIKAVYRRAAAQGFSVLTLFQNTCASQTKPQTMQDYICSFLGHILTSPTSTA